MGTVEPRRGIVVGARTASDALRRLFSVATPIRRWALRLALLGLAAAAVIAYTLLRHGFPDRPDTGFLTVVVLAVVLTPPVVLGAFWVVVGEVAALPDRVGRMPVEARGRADELRGLLGDLRERRGPRALPGHVWRVARLTSSSRELLSPYAPLLPLLNVPFLVAVGLSALAVLPVVAGAVAAAIVLLVG